MMKFMRVVVFFVVFFSTIGAIGKPVMYKDNRITVVENGEAILLDSFERMSSKWKGVYLAGAEHGGSYEVKDGKMIVTATAPQGSVFNEHHPPNKENIFF